MEILHVSAECYPMAKAGGLADVVGALPKYQVQLGHFAKVVIPMYRTKFLYDNDWDVVHKGNIPLGSLRYDFTIIKERHNKLGFDLYCVDINGLLDREKVYGYDDDTQRFLAFQVAVVDWLSKWEHQPSVVHVHDNHAALVPFMMQYCYAYMHLAGIPTVLTIHNAEYQGWMEWAQAGSLPAWDSWKWGLLDWNKTVNPLACGIKCAHKVTTVSPGYMEELKLSANGLEVLIRNESAKCSGILNGIDYAVWDPQKDTYILDNFSVKDFEHGKQLNKKKLSDDFDLDLQLPLFVFIGRLVGEKAADLLPGAIARAFYELKQKFSFVVLGNGEPIIEKALGALENPWIGFYNSHIGYNEKLSHQMYAGADFLLMPSRVEPCGLNQMYAMRYATVPVVRRTGGLKDTVIDIGDPGGYGICFDVASIDDIVYSMHRAVDLYNNKKKLRQVRKAMMEVHTSWEDSAGKYLDLYESLKV